MDGRVGIHAMQAVLASMLGIFFGAVYIRTGNIIATMISIFSNVLSGVLGAVADKGKSEKSSDESAQSESNDSSSSLE